MLSTDATIEGVVGKMDPRESGVILARRTIRIVTHSNLRSIFDNEAIGLS